MSDLYDKQEFERVGMYLLDVVVPLFKEIGKDEAAKQAWLTGFDMCSKHLEYYVNNPLSAKRDGPKA